MFSKLISDARAVLESSSPAQKSALKTLVAYRAEHPTGPGRQVGDKVVPLRVAKALKKAGLVVLTSEYAAPSSLRSFKAGASSAKIQYHYAKPTDAGIAAAQES